jgi:hypothetical protein
MLRAELRVGIPAGIEEHEDGLDVCLEAIVEEGVEALLEAFGILLPELVLQEDAHGVHADALRHAEFFVVELRIPGGGLKHFELIDGVGGNVVCADEPGLLRVPGVGLLGGPARRVLGYGDWLIRQRQTKDLCC